MSKPRLQLQAVIDTEAHADTIIASIRAELVGKDVFEEHSLQRSKDDHDRVLIIFDFRFNSEIDRDSVKTCLRDQVRDHLVVKTWVRSVKLTKHQCSHDESTILDCKATDFTVEFERV